MKIIVLSGVIGFDITANSVREDLDAAKGEDVEFHASGPGGLVYEGIEIFNVIRAYTGRTEFLITGIAASMMSYIALATDKVKAYDNATFMIHNPWNIAIGDYNDVQDVADTLKGLTGILANEYIKQTNKSKLSMKALMDKDSYFFGDEMLKEGFVDEILEAPESDDSDKATAIITARASVDACKSRLRDSEAANADMHKAVAYMDSMSALMDKPTPPVVAVAKGVVNNPAGAGSEKQEDKHMDLKELLAANPSAKAEHDAAIAKARTEGATAAKDEMKDVIAKVSPILGSDDYPAAVKDYGVKAITGEGALATFDALVVMEDQKIEAAKAAAALAESKKTPETPGAAAGSAEVVDAEAQAKFDEKMKRTGKVA